VGSKSGTIKGRINLEPTNDEWVDVECELTSPINGIKDMFFTFSGAGTSLFDFDNWQFMEEGTHISTPKNAQQSTDGAIYNIGGQRVNKQGKGISIVNGKKILK